MRIAPDKNNPFPGMADSGNGGGKNGGNGGAKQGNTIPFAPGAVNDFAREMVAIKGGDVDKWKAYYKALYDPVYVPDYSWEKRGGGSKNGGGKNSVGGDDPNTGGRPDTYHGPQHRSVPMVAQTSMQGQQPMSSGFLNVGPAGQRLPPTLGLLNRPNQQQNAPGGFLPPEIQLMLSQRR